MNKINYDSEMKKIIGTFGGEKKTLLLHSCCGPCSTAVIEKLEPFFDLTVFDLLIEDAKSLRIFRRDDDAAGVAVDAVAERGGKGVLLLRPPFALLRHVGLNVGDEGVVVPHARAVAQHTGLFVHQQDVLVLIDDVEPRRRNFEPGILLRRSFKKLVVDV